MSLRGRDKRGTEMGGSGSGYDAWELVSHSKSFSFFSWSEIIITEQSLLSEDQW